MVSSMSVVLSLALLGVVKSQGFVPGVANQCFEPVQPGPCRAFIPSFYFNPLTGACDCFIYGGCQANGNKFGRLDECMNTCSVRPRLQTISPTCIRIFGADNANFAPTQRPITPRPVTFAPPNQLPVVTDFPAVPATARPTTTRPTTARPTTAAPIRHVAPVVTAAPARPTSNNVQSSGPTIQQGDLIIVRNQDFDGTSSVVGSIFSQGGLSGQTTITIGQPVFIGRRTSNDDDDK